MGISLDDVSRKIVEYHSLNRLLQKEGAETDASYRSNYNRALYLSQELRNVVLTGSEMVEKGIVEKIREDLELNRSSEKLEKLELEKEAKYTGVYRNAIRKLGGKLKRSYEGLENYKGEMEEIRSIIFEKQGSIIDEIRSVVESVAEDNT